MIGRRAFLLRGAPVTTAACASASLPLGHREVDDWTALRAEFSLDPSYVHLAQMLLASHPRPVSDAIERHRRALDANPAGYLIAQGEALEAKARAAAAAYCGGRPEEIALTTSTTMGLALVYGGIGLHSGDEALVTTHDHYSTYESLRLRALRTGARVRKVALYDGASVARADEIVDRLRRALAPETRIVGVTWVHSSTGVKLPIRAMADVIAAANAARPPERRILFVVDGVHGFGIEAEPAASLGCDFFVAGCHKWLFGPRGSGIVWATREAWRRHVGLVPSFEHAALGAWIAGDLPEGRVPPGPLASPGGFHAFEHRWALPEAFALHERIGRHRITARVRALADRCKASLAALPHVTLHTPRSPALSASLVCFEVRGLRPLDVVKRLQARRIIASTTPYAQSYARFSISPLNTPEEIDRASAEVRALG
jgi:selenocysteine lyase/cysteine desulfurase